MDPCHNVCVRGESGILHLLLLSLREPSLEAVVGMGKQARMVMGKQARIAPKKASTLCFFYSPRLAWFVFFLYFSKALYSIHQTSGSESPSSKHVPGRNTAALKLAPSTDTYPDGSADDTGDDELGRRSVSSAIWTPACTSGGVGASRATRSFDPRLDGELFVVDGCPDLLLQPPDAITVPRRIGLLLSSAKIVLRGGPSLVKVTTPSSPSAV